MLKDTISQILGERAETDLTDSIKKTINSFDKVNGTYDLILNNYGPDIYLASAHIEIPSDMTAGELDALTRTISAKVYEEHQVILAAVGIYAVQIHIMDVTSYVLRIYINYYSTILIKKKLIAGEAQPGYKAVFLDNASYVHSHTYDTGLLTVAPYGDQFHRQLHIPVYVQRRHIVETA